MHVGMPLGRASSDKDDTVPLDEAAEAQAAAVESASLADGKTGAWQPMHSVPWQLVLSLSSPSCEFAPAGAKDGACAVSSSPTD